MSEFQEKYEEAIGLQLQIVLKPLLKNKAFLNHIGNFLLDMPNTPKFSKRHSNRDYYFGRVAFGYFEIMESWYILNDILKYIDKLPSSRSKLNRSRYLSYHVENYYNENYIFYNRLRDYLTKLFRSKKKSPDYKNNNRIIRVLLDAIDLGFKDINKFRGSHVHVTRMKDSDIDRALQWEIMIGSPSIDNTLDISSLPIFKDWNAYLLKDAKNKWLAKLKQNNEAISQFLDIYFKTLYPIVFKENGELIYP